MFKFLLIIYIVVYVVCVGLWTMANFSVFGFDQVELPRQVLGPMGYPWRVWFRDQLTDFSAPIVTMAILWIAHYLAKRDRRGMAR